MRGEGGGGRRGEGEGGRGEGERGWCVMSLGEGRRVNVGHGIYGDMDGMRCTYM